MSLEIEKEALKKEKDDISKNRTIEINKQIDTLKEKESVLRKDWEQEKHLNDDINKKKEELSKIQSRISELENEYGQLLKKNVKKCNRHFFSLCNCFIMITIGVDGSEQWFVFSNY